MKHVTFSFEMLVDDETVDELREIEGTYVKAIGDSTSSKENDSAAHTVKVMQTLDIFDSLMQDDDKLVTAFTVELVTRDN